MNSECELVAAHRLNVLAEREGKASVFALKIPARSCSTEIAMILRRFADRLEQGAENAPVSVVVRRGVSMKMNKTERLCLNELSHAGKLSAVQLAKRVGVTYEHARRSLFSLRQKKLVDVQKDYKKKSVRPTNFYVLKEKAVRFPHD